MNINQTPPFPIGAIVAWGIVCAGISGGATYLLSFFIPPGVNEILNSFGIDLSQMVLQAALFAAGSGLIFGIVLRAIIHSFKHDRS